MNNERGFIALISVIIISAIMMVLVFTLEAASFFQRFDALDAENKRISLGLAEACANVGRLDIEAGNYIESPAASIVVDASDPKKTCKICKAGASGDINTRAVYNGAYTNLSITLNSDFSVTKWQEVAANLGPACTLP